MFLNAAYNKARGQVGKRVGAKAVGSKKGAVAGGRHSHTEQGNDSTLEKGLDPVNRVVCVLSEGKTRRKLSHSWRGRGT